MANIDLTDFSDELMEIPHEFVIELNCLVVVSHQLPLSHAGRLHAWQLGDLEPNRLGVIARTSAMQYKAPGKTLARSAASWAWTTFWKEVSDAKATACALLHN